VSAIFISYTGRDPEGDAWADRLTEWFKEWNYGYFRDKDHSHGVKAGDDWHLTLYSELADARAMVCICSKQYDSSPWCVGEVAIALKDGKTVIPIQLAGSEEDLNREPLPLLLQTKQAIKVTDAANPSSGQLAVVKQRLQATLQEKLNWRDRQHWDRSLAPYPGLPAFEAHQAPVFFGRDKSIEEVVERLAGLALRPKAFLLLLGASGYGKSSLVRAGVVPRLMGEGVKAWTVLAPFTPGDEPFKELEEAVEEAGGVFHNSDPLTSLTELRSKTKAPVVLVIDQFEELLTAGPKEDGKEDQGEVFQRFLLQLLRVPKAGLMVLATMRTDFLAPLQTRWPALTGMASTYTLEPIEPEDFGALITGPADRSRLNLEAGLEARLVNESGGRDALPLLAFTLEKLWKAKEGQMLTLKAYADLGGVEGAVSTRAAECWNPHTSTEGVRQALRQAFLEHLVSVSSDGREAKRPAPLAELPIESREIVQRMVDDRLLVQKDGIVEIAHEALLRTWEPLVKWIEEDKEQLLQCLRVKRLSDDLKLEAPERQRRQALEQLAAMAAAGGSEARAVRKEGTTTLTELLKADACPLADREDAALVLALIGVEDPLRACLANEKVPVALRRRAAESLGLIASRSKSNSDRDRIKMFLELYLFNNRLNLVVKDKDDWIAHDTELPILQGASRGIQLAVSNELPILGQGLLKEVPMATIEGHLYQQSIVVHSDVISVPVWIIPLPNGEKIELVKIGDGEYRIGAPPNEQAPNDYDPDTFFDCRGIDIERERSRHIEAFAISRFPITQSQWNSVRTFASSNSDNGYQHSSFDDPKGLWERYCQTGSLPMESVSWQDCQNWLVSLNSWVEYYWKDNSLTNIIPRFRLPSEDEWEAACRSGSRSPYHFGDLIDSSWAHYKCIESPYRGRSSDIYHKRPKPVGWSGLFNRFGLSDMHGQVWEWCQDEWMPSPICDLTQAIDSYDKNSEIGQSQPLSRRVMRGGSWFSYASICRSAFRRREEERHIFNNLGLRPCCSL
jgi:formylglycine-generating enzyme required for sulfatase activity